MARPRTPIWDRLVPKIRLPDGSDGSFLPTLVGTPTSAWPLDLQGLWLWVGSSVKPKPKKYSWMTSEGMNYAFRHSREEPQFWVGSKRVQVNRLLYELLVAPIPADHVLRSNMGAPNYMNVNPLYWRIHRKRPRGQDPELSVEDLPYQAHAEIDVEIQELADMIFRDMDRGTFNRSTYLVDYSDEEIDQALALAT